MDTCYLMVVKVQGIHYLQLTEDGSIRAYETVNEAKGTFNSFKDKMLNSSYESHISGSMGIMNIRPNIIKVDKDNPSMIEKYLIDSKPLNINGQMMGVFIDMVGAKVSEDILKLSVCDITSEYMKEVFS